MGVYADQAQQDSSERKGLSQYLCQVCTMNISKLLADKGKEFTDGPFANRERQATGKYEFDQLCERLGMERRFAKPRTPGKMA